MVGKTRSEKLDAGAEPSGEEPRRTPPLSDQLTFLHKAVADISTAQQAGSNDLSDLKAQMSDLANSMAALAATRVVLPPTPPGSNETETLLREPVFAPNLPDAPAPVTFPPAVPPIPQHHSPYTPDHHRPFRDPRLDGWSRTVKIPRQPFNGDRSRARAYCQQVDTALEHFGQLHTFEGFLWATSVFTGPARAWLDLISHTQPVHSWAALRGQFLAEFESPNVEYDARKHLEILRQTGSVDEYSAEFRRLLTLLPRMSDFERQFLYREHLSDRMKQYIAHRKEFPNVQALMNFAGQMASDLGENANTTSVPVVNAVNAATTGQTCYRCHAPGHIARDCPSQSERGRTTDRSARTWSRSPRRQHSPYPFQRSRSPSPRPRVKYSVPVQRYAGVAAATDASGTARTLDASDAEFGRLADASTTVPNRQA